MVNTMQTILNSELYNGIFYLNMLPFSNMAAIQSLEIQPLMGT